MPKLFLVAFLFIIFAFPVFGQNYPIPVGYVNDFAAIYSDQFISELNQNLTEFKNQTGNEIAVVTIKSLEGVTVEEYAVKLFEKWAIGQKDKDNGLLLLIAPNDRQVRLEVGYGLEGRITDGTAGHVLDNYLLPDFKNGKYEDGTQKTIDVLQNYLTDSSQIPASTSPRQLNPDWLVIVFLIFFFGIPVYFLSYLSRSREVATGAIVGAILGYLVYGLVLALFLGIFGLVLDIILSRNYKKFKALGLPTGFWSSRGGFGGGFKGGGGFGGFGGGSSGGGGASRSW